MKLQCLRILLLILFTIAAVKDYYAQENQDAQIALLGRFPLSGFVYDVTGYYDANAQKEYAIAGGTEGVWIVDVTNPFSPSQASFLPDVPGFDLKVWKNYLYCVTGGGGLGQGKIFDISNPSDPELKNSFFSSHNIFISDSGYLFAEAPGLKIYDLNADPVNPRLVWESNSSEGHDATVIDDFVYDFHGGAGTNIYRITYNPEFTMSLLSTIKLPLIKYHHSGWITNDKQYLFICDEGASHPDPDITVWDISDPENPEFITQYADPKAKVHNLYIIDNHAYTAYYSSGFRVFDISNPAEFKVAGEYDTNTSNDENFNGAFGCYPFTHSGNVYISDQTGLYIFNFTPGSTDVDKEIIPEDFALYQNYPNPFNPSTRISFAIGEPSFVSLRVYDMLGNEIATLVNEEKPAGIYEVEFSARTVSISNGINLSSGIYLYTLKAGNYSQTKKLMLMK